MGDINIFTGIFLMNQMHAPTFERLKKVTAKKHLRQFDYTERALVAVAHGQASMRQRHELNEILKEKFDADALQEEREENGKERLPDTIWEDWDFDATDGDFDRKFHWRYHSAEWYERNNQHKPEGMLMLMRERAPFDHVLRPT